MKSDLSGGRRRDADVRGVSRGGFGTSRRGRFDVLYERLVERGDDSPRGDRLDVYGVRLVYRCVRFDPFCEDRLDAYGARPVSREPGALHDDRRVFEERPAPRPEPFRAGRLPPVPYPPSRRGRTGPSPPLIYVSPSRRRRRCLHGRRTHIAPVRRRTRLRAALSPRT